MNKKLANAQFIYWAVQNIYS